MCRMYCACCGRYKYSQVKRTITHSRKRVPYKKKAPKKKKVPTRKLEPKRRPTETCVQYLSRLCESCTYPLPQPQKGQRFQEVTPDVICESLLKLSEWQETVSFTVLLSYIRDNYQVSTAALRNEVREKLLIAHKAGKVCVNCKGRWRLTTTSERLRQVPKSELSLFWEVYCDTMDPLTLRHSPPKPKVEKRDEGSENSPPSDD